MTSLTTKNEKQISQLIKQGGGDEHPGENVEYTMETDPLFKDIDEEKKKEIDKLVEDKVKSLTLEENVDTDIMNIPGQNYALISIVAPGSNQKHDSICLKIKGVYDKMDEARKQAEILQKMDDTFDIYVVELYKWLLVPPDPELLEQVHLDQKLNDILVGHREDQLKSKMYFEERKRELMNNIELENKKRIEENENEKETLTETETKTEPETETLTETLTETDKNNSNEQVSGAEQESIQDNLLKTCPTSLSTSTPSEILEEMNKPFEIPKKRWSDED